MKLKIITAAAVVLVASNLAMVAFTTMTTSRHAIDLQLKANQRLVETAALGLQRQIQSAIFAGHAITSENQLSGNSNILSVGTIEWQADNFNFANRIDGPRAKTLSNSLQNLHNDILNVGANQEQVYSVLADAETPALLLISPLKKAVSSFVVIESSGLIPQATDSTDSTLFAVDRFGTIILHPDEERAVTRESAAKDPIVKRLFASSAEKDVFKFSDLQNKKDFMGIFSRVPFAAITVASRAEIQTPVFPTGPSQFKFILAGLSVEVVAISGLYLLALILRYRGFRRRVRHA